MKTITDHDLTLLYYGEHNDLSLAAQVADSDDLSRRFEALCAELALLDELSPPERDDGYGADVWHRIEPQLTLERTASSSHWRNWLTELGKPRLSLAGAFSVVAVVTLAFFLGRQGNQDNNLLPGESSIDVATTGASLNTEQILARSVADHLDQLNVTFTRFANASELPDNLSGQATDLLVANRLYRQAAAARGNQKLASFLDEVEPMLIELAYEAFQKSPATRARMQQDMKDSLLFRIRVMNQQITTSQIST